MNVNVNEIQQLQLQQARTRNMCIMAHVDHGKTTLSDHLIATNGLIHPKMVGELRYLDSRDDEQARGITMKSSSISLLYVPGAAARPEGPRSVSSAEKVSSGYLVNLIDSPGHVDFCSEVSTAARLSDGALVVVDAVEGVCIQTHAVLRQAWEEKVKPCLMVNKMDRLITELKLSPAEAASRLTAIVAHANMIWSAFDSEHFMREADAVLAAEQQQQQQQQRDGGADASDPSTSQAGEQQQQHQDQEEEDVFQPSKGNVAFGSASDGWAFRLDQFADMYSAKLGAKPDALVQALWGDWCFLPKERRVVRGSKARSGGSGGGRSAPRSMFEQFALEPIWRAYSVCEGEEVQAVLGPIVSSRALTHLVPPKLLEPGADPRTAVRAVLKAWLPLSEAVLGMAVAHLPSPVAAAPVRLPHLLSGGSNTALLPLAAAGPSWAAGGDNPPAFTGSSGNSGALASSNGSSLQQLADAAAGAAGADADSQQQQQHEQQQSSLLEVQAQLERSYSHLCASSSSSEAPLVVFVSKMVAVPANLLPRRVGEAGEQGEGVSGEVFLAFGRVFSGVAREGARVQVLSAAYDPLAPGRLRQTAVLRGLYLMMGRSLERLSSVPAGNVLALSGLETTILKSATLSSSPACLPLAPMTFQAAPIVRVALEPSCPSDMAALSQGLKLLNRADPFVEVGLSEKGEHLLGAAGEVHLETVVKDLQERFARVPFQVSPPLVAFKESVLSGSEGPEGVTVKPARVVEAATPSGVCVVRVKAHALPNSTAALLDEHAHLIKDLLGQQHRRQQDRTQQQQQQQQGGDQSQQKQSSSSSSGVNGVQHNTSSSNSKQQRRSLEATGGGNERLREAAKLREAYSHTTQELAASNKPLTQLLQRAWLLGPRNVGPNIALCSPCRAANSSSNSSSSSSSSASLFDVPASHVVRASSRHAPLSKLTGTAAAEQPAVKHHSEHAAHSTAAAGHEAGQAAAAADSADAAAAAADPAHHHQQQQQQQQYLNVPFGWPAAAAMLSGQHTPGPGDTAAATAAAAAAAAGVSELWPHITGSVESGVTAGFQLASAAGPLCDEPLWGVVFEVEVRLVLPAQQQQQQQQQEGAAAAASQAAPLDLAEGVYGPFSGQVMGALCSAARRAVLEADPRLVEALYLSQVQAAAEALSGVYAVLGRRRARILQEELREGSGSFLVHAYLPVEASFGLADEMRRRSSGAASASLLLSHWERLQVDPFFVPTTEEELEEYGTEAGGPANLARRLIDAVRRRKGLPVEEKVVAKATKQRTLTRNV